MFSLRRRGLFLATVLVATVLLGSALPTMAQDSEPIIADFAAGVACSFHLQTTSYPTGHYVNRVFSDRDGNVRVLQAGKGADIVYANMDTGATLMTPANGSDYHWTIYPDGTARLVATGHTVVIMFATDIPAGPSTTLYVGRVVITVAADGTWTVESESGVKTDICAALSG